MKILILFLLSCGLAFGHECDPAVRKQSGWITDNESFNNEMRIHSDRDDYDRKQSLRLQQQLINQQQRQFEQQQTKDMIRGQK
jgi:hypothetical protein